MLVTPFILKFISDASAYLGEIIAEIKPQLTESTGGAKVTIRETALSIPYNSKTDKFETLEISLIQTPLDR